MAGQHTKLISVAGTGTRTPSPTRQRKNSCRLLGPIGEPDYEALRSFIRECLVPLLAEEFLRQRDVAEKNTVQRQVNFQTPRQGGGQTDRDSQ